MTRIVYLGIGITLIWMAGCAPVEKMTISPAASNAPPAQPAEEKSTARQAIEGFTGKTAVDAGQRTKARIQAIEDKRRQDADEMPPF